MSLLYRLWDMAARQLAKRRRRMREDSSSSSSSSSSEEENTVIPPKKLTPAKFECVICFNIPSTCTYSCDICGELYCQLCTATLSKGRFGGANCSVCREGVIRRNKFAEKLRNSAFIRQKVKCGGCRKRGYMPAITAHQAYCFRRLVLCPDMLCSKPAMPLKYFLAKHCKARVDNCRVTKVGPWREHEDGSVEFKLTHTSATMRLVFYFPEMAEFTPVRVFLNSDSIASAGFYMLIKRVEREWHFNFFSYLSEEEARNYKIELFLYRAHYPAYSSLWNDVYAKHLNSMRYGKYMDPIAPFYTLTCTPSPQYTKFHPCLTCKCDIEENYVLRRHRPTAKTVLTDDHIRRIAYGAMGVPKIGERIPSSAIQLANDAPLKMSMFIKVSKRSN